jgi:hypothetical protein
MQDLSLQAIVLPALIFAVALSAPRFLGVLMPGDPVGVAAAPTSMLASAICLSAIAMAVADHGPVRGTMIAVSGLLLSRAIPISHGAVPAVLAAVPLAIYLQARPGLL